MFDLTGKTVVVTGGSRGIGRGIARSLLRCNAAVVISGRDDASLAEARTELSCDGGRVLSVVADSTSREDVDRLVEQAVAFGVGRVDAWVNNAGSARSGDVGPLIDLTEQQWDAVVDLNLKWSFFAAQAAARVLGPGGSIVNISSRSGSQPNPMTGHYGAAKAGLENLTATMAVEWGHLGIRVNAIAPGIVVTERSTAPGGTMSTEGRRRRQIETIPLGRLGTPDDVGALCVYLISDASSWMTGEVIQITGGSRVPVGYLTYLYRVNQASQ
jgi:NAD(P)-dependent dehydrogenase (short-subunit alcohol dehydrogenase family)